VQPSFTVRRVESLTDYLFDENGTAQVRCCPPKTLPCAHAVTDRARLGQDALRAARHFDGVDFIFADGEVDCPPWHPRLRPLLLLSRMVVACRKFCFAGGSAMVSLGYTVRLQRTGAFTVEVPNTAGASVCGQARWRKCSDGGECADERGSLVALLARDTGALFELGAAAPARGTSGAFQVTEDTGVVARGLNARCRPPRERTHGLMLFV
jgi:hypothetical protein